MKRQRDYSDDYHSILSQFPEEFDAALKYAKKLKARFQYDPPEEKINSFSRILKDAMVTRAARDGSVGRPTAVPKYFSARVKAILAGNRNLICGFNSLMPPLYQISLDDEEKKETEAAMERKRFGDQEIMDLVKKLSIKCGKDGCGELLKIFRLYKEKSRSLDDVCDFGHRLTEGHPDLQQDFLHFMPNTDLQSSKLANCRVDELQKKSPESFELSKKNKESEVVTADGLHVKGVSLDVAEKKKTEATTESKTVRYREGMDFVNKLKIKCGKDGCEEFLKTFNLFKTGSRNLVDVYDFGLRLTKDHADLQEEFIEFMPLSELEKPLACHLPDLQSSDLTNTRAADELQKNSHKDKETKFFKAVGSEVKGSESIAEKIREGLGFLEKVKKRLHCDVSYKNLLKLFFYYTKGKIGKAELKRMVADLIGKYPGLIDEFYNFWRNYDSVNVLEVRGCKERDRRMEKHRNISRIRDCSFKHKNGKNLFQCEDERYELDMLLQWFKSANTYAEQLEGCTVEKNGSERIFLRCIDRLYGNQGVEVLDIFHKDPQRALPVLRMRLQQKLAELMQYRQS